MPGGFEMGINTAGDVAGYYLDAGSVFHGYSTYRKSVRV